LEGDFLKKVIIVTGASRGLGQVIHQTLCERSDHIIYGTSRNPSQHGVKAGFLYLDVTEPSSIDDLVKEVLAREGRIDVLINNVGNNHIGSVEGTSSEELDLQMTTSFYGSVHLIKAVLPSMRHQGKGQIINISSMGALIPLPYNSAYAASKAALEAFTESMTYELRGKGIDLTLIEPIGLKIDGSGTTLKWVHKEVECYREESRGMYKALNKLTSLSVTKEKVAKQVLRVIQTNKPKLRYRVGKVSTLLLLMKKILPRKVFERLLMGQFI
jgi:short-subunit dehydrogenase